MKLTTKLVKALTEPGRYHDGAAGLYLSVKERNGRIRKSYMQRIHIHGKRCEIGLGSVRWTTPSEARAKAIANWKVARTGGDPRRRRAAIPTFEQAADAVIRMHAGNWRDGGKTEARWRATLAAYAFPRIGARPVSNITTADVLAALTHDGLWNEKRETARKVRQRIATIMDWAVAEGHRTDNPCAALKAALPRNGHKTRHQRALPYADVSDAIRRVRESGAWWATKAAFEFLVHTAARSGEVRKATWSEIDFEAASWTVPVARTKTGREHRVPLAPRALAILEEARAMADGTGLLFPSATGRVMSDMTLSKLVKELGIPAVPHGFRSSFRQWAAERTSTPREVAEHALAHVVGAESERAYQRSDLFDRRRELMNAWARYLEAAPARVVSIR